MTGQLTSTSKGSHRDRKRSRTGSQPHQKETCSGPSSVCTTRASSSTELGSHSRHDASTRSSGISNVGKPRLDFADWKMEITVRFGGCGDEGYNPSKASPSLLEIGTTASDALVAHAGKGKTTTSGTGNSGWLRIMVPGLRIVAR